MKTLQTQVSAALRGVLNCKVFWWFCSGLFKNHKSFGVLTRWFVSRWLFWGACAHVRTPLRQLNEGRPGNRLVSKHTTLQLHQHNVKCCYQTQLQQPRDSVQNKSRGVSWFNCSVVSCALLCVVSPAQQLHRTVLLRCVDLWVNHRRNEISSVLNLH